MKTWMWTRTAMSVLVMGLISISVGCQDAPKPMTPGGELAPTKTAAPGPAAPASGSGLSGGVDVPPPVQPDAADKSAADAKPAETEKPAADAKPAEGEKPAAETKPEGEKPAEEAKPAEEKKPE